MQNKRNKKTKLPKSIKKNGKSKLNKAPVATSLTRTMPLAKVQSGPRSTRVSHREYISDVNGSTTFATDLAININPGFASSFPWLSAIASRFESYIFNRLAFCYETTSATTAVGSIIMAVDYDATDAAPLSKAQMLSYKDAVRAAPWEMVKLVCDPKDLQKRTSFFNRKGTLPADSDLKLYDTGVLYVGVSGNADANVKGELYVEYDVTLMTPQIDQDVLSLQIEGNTGISKAAPFGTAPLVQGILPYSLHATGASIYVQVPGEYMFTYVFTGTGVTDSPSVIAGAGVSSYKVTAITLAAATAAIIVYAVRITNVRTGYFGIDSNASFTTVSASQLFVTQGDYHDFD